MPCAPLCAPSRWPFRMINELFCLSRKSRRERQRRDRFHPRFLLTCIWTALICMFYMCWEGVSIKILSDLAHTQLYSNTPQNSNASFLLYALWRCCSGPPCGAVVVRSSPSVRRSDATVARSVWIHIHTPNGPWWTGSCCYSVVCLFFVLPQTWAHFQLAVDPRLPLCWQVLPHLWTQGSYTPSASSQTNTHINTQPPHTLTAIKQHKRRKKTLSRLSHSCNTTEDRRAPHSFS